MDKQAFKQRMQNLKSYRENNPGKGYWDWKVQAYQNGGDIPLWQQYQYSGPSYQDVLDDLKQNSPSTYNQLQQIKAADSQSSSEIVRYVDSKGRLQSISNLQGLRPVITSDYIPGIGDAMEVTQIVQDVKNEDYGAALAGLGLLALPGNWLSKIKGLVNYIYNNVAPGSYYDSYIPGDSKKDELKKDANRARILPEWLKNKYMHIEVQPDGYQKRVMTDKEFQKWKKLTQNRYSEEYDRLNEQQSERLFEFVPKTEEELLDKYGIYVKKYSDGGEVSEFQRKTRRDIMQESLVDGRPDYNKMFQNQNEYQKDFANYWYTERAKNPKYSDQIGGDKLGSVLSNIDKATWKTPTEAMRDNMVGQGYNPTDAQINQQLNILKEKGTKGFANPKAHSYTSLRPANTWHEGVGHMVGDNTPAILNATPNVHINNPDSSYEDYVNQANEKHAQTWDFRGNNSNLKDDQCNYYIDPNRQLTPEDISNMRSKGAKIPEQWESLEDADISELTNTFAYNLSQDPIYYMANGGEIGDPDDEFTKAINTKLGRTPDGRPLQQGLKPVFDLEDAANLTPVGDAIAAKDMYNAAMDKDWTGLGLAAASMIPFVPSGMRKINKKFKQIPSVHKDTQQLLDALKRRTGKSTEELTHSKNPLTRKRAIFAQNAKKWKHKGRKKK